MRQILKSIGCARSQLVSLREFKNLPTNAFYDLDSDYQLMSYLKFASIKTLLDFDAHFAKSQLLTKVDNDFTEIDCISADELIPIKENIYRRVYKNFSDCQFKRYDAALVYGRTNIDFIAAFAALEGVTDVVITFVRYGADFENYINANINYFETIFVIPSFAGRWFMFHRHKSPKNFAMYVVTHKPLPIEHVENFPEGYKVIHAGRAISADFGYFGDNTGENISHLNPYLNELTALYWIWKNTNHSVIGLSHYRRFFTESIDDAFAYEKILTEKAVENLLQRYDIIVTNHFGELIQFDNIISAAGEEPTKFIAEIIKKHLAKNFPNYIEMFEKVLATRFFYKCGMFVTRKNIFSAYCQWLFSFIIDVCNEFLKNFPPDSLNGGLKRLIGYFGEIMLTVWLMKNRLRVKELQIMHTPNL